MAVTRPMAGALAGAAILLFGAAFGVGKATRGGEGSPTPQGAMKVLVRDDLGVPKLAGVDGVPKLRSKPKPANNAGGGGGGGGGGKGSTTAPTVTPEPKQPPVSKPTPKKPPPKPDDPGGGGEG